MKYKFKLYFVFLLNMQIPQKLGQVGHWLSENMGRLQLQKPLGFPRLLTPSCKHVIRPSPKGLRETQDIQMGVS